MKFKGVRGLNWILIPFFLSLAACANEDGTPAIVCTNVSPPPKALILDVGNPRASNMNVQSCAPGCFKASDSQGVIEWCE